MIMHNSSTPNIIVASVNKNAYSETFIKHHVQRLPYRVHFCYGGYYPTHADERPLIPSWLAGLYPINVPIIKYMLLRHIRYYKIKLVLAEYGTVAVHWMDVCKKAGIPLLVYFHGYDITRKAELIRYHWAYKRLFKQAALYYSVSHAMTDQLIKLGADPEKIVYNPCGADMDRFKPVDAGANEPILLAVGRFCETKGPRKTIRAFAKALKEVPEARLRMVGGGELYFESRKLANELSIDKQVDFLEVLASEAVSREMSHARAFVQHSVTASNGETEGAPVAIMEAGATGLPVISTIHAGIPDIIINGETGILVEEGDIDGMAKAMIAMLKDPEKASEMGRKAHQHVQQYFSLQRNIRILTETMERFL